MTTPRRAIRPDPNRAAVLLIQPEARCFLCGTSYMVRWSLMGWVTDCTPARAWKAAASALKLEVG